MSLSGSRLESALASDIYTQLQDEFPINSNLQSAEKTYLATAQQDLANALAAAIGPDVVTEVVSNALVATNDSGTVTSGLGVGGLVVATGTGTVS